MSNETLKSCGIVAPAVSNILHRNTNIIAKIGLTSATLSLLGSLSILIYTVVRKLMNNQHVRPLFHLSLAETILSVIWIGSTLKYFFAAEFEHPAYTAVSCFVWQLLAELVHLATFFLTINYALHVYLRMLQRTVQVHMVSEGGESHVPVSCLSGASYVVSWCAPLLLLLPIFINIRVDHISACQKCVILIDVPVLLCGNITPAYGYIVLACSLTVSTLLIILIYSASLKLYWKAVPGFRTDNERQQFANMQSRVTLYMLVFIVCWAPAFMISYHKWLNHSNAFEVYGGVVDVEKFFWLYVFQAVLAPLQGFANSVVYGWSRKQFRESQPPIQQQEAGGTENIEGFKNQYVDFTFR